MIYLLDDLDLTDYVAGGLAEMEAFLLKRALFAIYCDLRDR